MFIICYANHKFSIQNLDRILIGINHKSQNKEAQLCYSDATGKFFPNMYINKGNFGGRDSLIKFQCIDTNSNPLGDPCFMSVLNMYTKNQDNIVDEYKRSTLTCQD